MKHLKTSMSTDTVNIVNI